MNQVSNYEKTVEHQFDSFCKTVLRNQARDIYDETSRRNERLISLDALNSKELSQLSFNEVYATDYISINTYDCDIHIQDFHVAQAISSLSKRKQDIILLSYFLDMTNKDIAVLLDLAESTVHYHRSSALNELKKIMEDYSDEE